MLTWSIADKVPEIVCDEMARRGIGFVGTPDEIRNLLRDIRDAVYAAEVAADNERVTT